jgi:hypothetical protein
MAMKTPFFHGDDKEDLLYIKEMIRRFERHGIGQQRREVQHVGNYLKGPAAILWQGMEWQIVVSL